MNIVRCNDCGWIGSEDEAFTVLNLDEPLICPTCGSDSNIEQYIDYNMDDFTDEQVKKLWDLFGDIEIGFNDDFIRDEFLGFPAYTNRFEIWKWFDQHYSKGVYSLAYQGGE